MQIRKKMQFKFSRRTTNLPDAVDRIRTFHASSYHDALQAASDYWFSGAKVGDTYRDNNGVITLCDADTKTSLSGGNVLGTLFDMT